MSNNLLLPTSFLSDAVCAFNLVPKQFTPEIRRIRACVASTSVSIVAMPYVNNNHYMAFVYSLGSATLLYGDSLHHNPPAYMLPIMQWLFNNLGHRPITGFTKGDIDLQQSGSGEGSCGVAALNFIALACKTHKRQ